MKRRRFLSASAPAALALGGALSGCRADEGSSAPAVRTDPRVTWRLVSSFPRALDTLYGAAEHLGRRVAALTDGRFTIRAYPAGEIVPALQVLDATQQATVEVAQTVSYYFGGKNPAFAFDTAIPFGLTARQQSAWLLEGGGLRLMREVFADFGLVNFTAGSTGVQMGGWFRREVGSLADLRGLKMRIPAMGGEVMSRLGATVQVIAGGDIFPALERGAIDATEWIGPYDDEKLGFHRAARYYYYPGWWEPGPSLTFVANRKAWDGLPAAYREAFESACADVGSRLQAQYDALNPPALARLLASGVELRRFPRDLMDRARELTEEILAEQAARSSAFRKVYDAWRPARDAQFAWWKTAELSYGEFAFRRAERDGR